MNDELLTVFHEDGTVAESQPRSVVHAKLVRYWHGVVNVWLINPQGELLVSRRSETVSGNPGKWQSYFGGHVSAGFSFKEAAVKEIAEEIGLTINPISLHLIDAGKFANEDHLHFYESYAYLFSGTIAGLTFTDKEIDEVKWLRFEAYNLLLNSTRLCGAMAAV